MDSTIKGVLTVLLIQKEQRITRSMLKRIGLNLEDFNACVELSKKVKSLMENGIIDFDTVKEATLSGLLIMETMTPEELADIWEIETERNIDKHKLSKK
jgi:hypothetical protein